MRPVATTLSSQIRAATRRIWTDERGPGQQYAVQAITAARALTQRANAVTPAHNGVEGNEMADLYAKATAENTSDAVSRQLLREASLALISRSIAETKANDIAK